MGGGQAPQTPTFGPESLLTLLAGAQLGSMSGQAQQAPQQKGNATATGETSMSSILPQLIQALSSPSPTAGAQAATKGGGQVPGKGPAEPASQTRPAQQAQEPAALSVLRLLGMVR